jgi:hypothetical protein
LNTGYTTVSCPCDAVQGVIKVWITAPQMCIFDKSAVTVALLAMVKVPKYAKPQTVCREGSEQGILPKVTYVTRVTILHCLPLFPTSDFLLTFFVLALF